MTIIYPLTLALNKVLLCNNEIPHSVIFFLFLRNVFVYIQNLQGANKACEISAGHDLKYGMRNYNVFVWIL